jgi:hypothetical protein
MMKKELWKLGERGVKPIPQPVTSAWVAFCDIRRMAPFFQTLMPKAAPRNLDFSHISQLILF